MTDSEKHAKVSELRVKENSLQRSIDIVVSSYKETSEEKSLRVTLANTTDEMVVEAIENRLKAFIESDLDTDRLIEICNSHGFSLPEVVKNGLSKIRGGYMFRRKSLSKELTSVSLPEAILEVDKMASEIEHIPGGELIKAAKQGGKA